MYISSTYSYNDTLIKSIVYVGTRSAIVVCMQSIKTVLKWEYTMFQIKASDSVAKQVNTILKSHIETKGENWLVSLGYGPSNDYAQSVVSLIMGLTGCYVRFETVARYVRTEKARIRAKQAAQPK